MSSTMCGYVLNRKEKSKITKIIFLVILSGMMFPYQMAVLGLYKLDKKPGSNEYADSSYFY